MTSHTTDRPLTPSDPIIALDLFAGSGWAVGARRLGIKDYGVEIMPEAVATREANGFETIFNDVWDGLEDPSLVPEYDLLIASPPCQGYSMAGKGSGRKALDDVLNMLDSAAYADPARLRDFGQHGIDERDVLVLSPLAYIYRDRPRYVALEQVPAVLPVWEAYAERMREWGYDVKVATLHAEQYGVPQTRKRAILVANLGGEAHLPTPTHSRYHSRNPQKLDEGVKKWVSMAEALGWGMTAKPFPTVGGGSNSTGKNGGPDRMMLGGSGARAGVYAERDAGRWVKPEHIGDEEIPYVTPEEAGSLQTYPRGWGFTDRPAVAVGNAVGRGLIGGSGAKASVVRAIEDGSFIPSIHGKDDSYAEQTRITVEEAGALQSYPTAVKNMGAGMVERHGERPGREADQPAFTIRAAAGGGEPGGFKWSDGEKMTAEQASTLQTYPTAPVLRNGNQANSAKRPLEAPAPTVHFGARSNKVEWMDPSLVDTPSASGERVTAEQASTFQSYPTAALPGEDGRDIKWPYNRPSPTTVGSFAPDAVAAPGYRKPGDPPRQKTPGSVRVTQEQASTLQSFPTEPPFTFCGTKTKVMLQIGNAVPPLLATHILEALVHGTQEVAQQYELSRLRPSGDMATAFNDDNQEVEDGRTSGRADEAA